jgi:hypothetical protein
MKYKLIATAALIVGLNFMSNPVHAGYLIQGDNYLIQGSNVVSIPFLTAVAQIPTLPTTGLQALSDNLRWNVYEIPVPGQPGSEWVVFEFTNYANGTSIAADVTASLNLSISNIQLTGNPTFSQFWYDWGNVNNGNGMLIAVDNKGTNLSVVPNPLPGVLASPAIGLGTSENSPNLSTLSLDIEAFTFTTQLVNDWATNPHTVDTVWMAALLTPSVTAAPEPSSLMVLLAGIMSLPILRRYSRRGRGSPHCTR